MSSEKRKRFNSKEKGRGVEEEGNDFRRIKLIKKKRKRQE